MEKKFNFSNKKMHNARCRLIISDTSDRTNTFFAIDSNISRKVKIIQSYNIIINREIMYNLYRGVGQRD